MQRRNLNTYEIMEAQLVFGDSIAYERVRIHEEVAWPNWVGRLGSWISRTEAPKNNAVTLGNKLYFPVRLSTANPAHPPSTPGDMSWLIHELTHVWQYHQFGIAYVPGLMRIHFRFRSEPYAYGFERGLRDGLASGGQLENFNFEQQGEIARHYYYRLKQGQDVSAWLPYIAAFQTRATYTSA